MKKRLFAVLAAGILLVACAFALLACGNKPPVDDDDKSNVDVFAENAEYKEFYETITKIENALFGSQTASARTTNRVYNAAYSGDNSLSGVASVIDGAINKLAADEVAGFEPEITRSLYSTYKGMFASSFSLAKQMGDGITRLKNKKTFYDVVMEFQPGNDGNSYYYVIEKHGNHLYQIIYSPELVTKIVNTDGNETLNIRQEYYALTDVAYTDDNSFEFSMLTLWGENEQLAFSYGNSAKRIMYGQTNGNELYTLEWADGDLVNNTKQISFGSSEEKCKEMSPTFTPLYDYIDKSYVKAIANRKDVSLTQEELDEITAIWAEQVALDQGEDSPWRIESGVLTGCSFNDSTAEPTETVTIPDNFVMISSNFIVADKTGTVKNLVIPSSVAQVKQTDNTNRWQTVDASYFDPRIAVSPSYNDSHSYRFSHVRSESPLFKTDDRAGMLLTTDTNEAFYLFDADRTECDLTGVTLSDNLGSSLADSRYMDKVKTIKANAKRIYSYINEENPGEIVEAGSKVFDYRYDERTVYRIFGENGVNLDLLEIHYGKPCDSYFDYGYDYMYDRYLSDLAGRFTIAPTDPYGLNMAKTIAETKKSEIKKLKIVADGYKYVYLSADDGKFDNYTKGLSEKTADELRSMASVIENRYASRFNAWKNSDETRGLDERYLTLEYFLSTPRNDSERDDYFSYVNIQYYLVFKEKYPNENVYSVIRSVECPDGTTLVRSDSTVVDYKEYKAFNTFTNVKEINVAGEYQNVFIGNEINDSNYPTITVNVSATAKFTELKFYDNVFINDTVVSDYVYTRPHYLVKLPVTKAQFESDALVQYRKRVLEDYGNDYLNKLKENDYFDNQTGVKYEFASVAGTSPLITNYYVKFDGIVAAYIDETSDNTTITLPADCDTLRPDMTFTTKKRLAKVVVPDNYVYYLGQGGTYTAIRDVDAWLFSWDNLYLEDGSPNTNRLKAIEISDNQPLFKIVGNTVYSKDGSVELNRMTAQSSVPTTREPYPSQGVNVDDDFIANDGFLRYTFENVTSIGYNVTGNVSIDLTLFEGLDPTSLLGIFIGENATVTSVNLNLNGFQYAEFAFSLGCSKDEFKDKYGDDAYSLFWNDYFKTGITYDFFAANGYCYVQGVDPEGTAKYIQFIFTDSSDSEYDVRHSGFDMSQPSEPDIPKEDQDELPAVKGTDFKVIRFSEFEWLLTSYPNKAMNYHLGSIGQLTDVVIYFDVTKSAFAKLAGNYDVEKFIAWEKFAVPSDMTFAAFAEANYEYVNQETGARIKFAFGIKGLTDDTSELDPSEPDPNEPDPSLAETPYTAEFKGQVVNFKSYVKKGYSGANYCTEITIHTGFDKPVTGVNYAMNEGDKISNVVFNFTSITKAQFINLYVGQDVFGFRQGYFAIELDFDNPTSEDDVSFYFYDGDASITFNFMSEESPIV